MKLKIIFFGFSLLISNLMFAQVPHDINVASNGDAERVARFKVQDEARDFLEITNSTNQTGKFIPSIWAHQQSDNRYVLRNFATTTSAFDTGSIPLMIFRAELRNNINLNAPSGGSFPWGTSASNVVNRPVFAWENGNTQLMTLRANGNLGLGTTTPSARLHTNGAVRFQNLSNGTTATFMLGTDTSGNVREYPVPSGGGSSDADWFKTTGGIPTSINDNIYTNGQVGIGTSSPTAQLHTTGKLRFENLPFARSATYILGTDANGNVQQYSNNFNGVSLRCLLVSPQTPTNRLTKVTSSGDLTCSQVFDNGTNVGVGTVTPTYKLSVNGPVHSMANIFISDKKFKKNIVAIENPLETLLKLNGKKYDWRVGEFDQYDFTDRKQIGFIAQEVKQIIPEIVHVDKSGEHSMNYTALIPVLVEAIKEQQNQIILLENKLSDIEQLSSSTDEGLKLGDRTSFSTNYPNPFNTTTTVDYFILKTVNSAKIIIYDSNGTTINTFKLDERGRKSQLVINKDSLKSGIYFYTLIADNIVMGTKKMIVK
ncbi:tail fiber domain-containing protein [Kordia sp. YSTF-M3]|uniref:Tail fiber domain-containing protein n=1 Tax=Kordia aestuariivivens TaxID=2759037 RepID=A0ABR7QD13_9FLAO|nr:tail fiber domain-containing protein [Kordia aestuariivivens]MBC8756460.1 tail fiber domain-containing protein [Kordia aestuariivivens]